MKSSLVGRISLFALACCAFLATGSPLCGQWARVDYMKVEQGKESDYVQLERNFWKKIHAERLKAGIIVSWGLWAVDFPSGTEADYNFVTVNMYDSFEKLGVDQYPDSLVSSAYPNGQGEYAMNQTPAARKLVRTEVYWLVDRIGPDGTTPPSRYIGVDYMKVKGDTGEYLSVERDLWKPVHSERFKDGLVAGWWLWGLRMPGGTSYSHDYVTVNDYNEFRQLENSLPQSVYEKAYPNGVPADMGSRTAASRDLVRAEVWELVDYVQ